MAVNYNDKRFQQVNNEKATALKEVNSTYNNMINSTDKLYQDQIDAMTQYGDTQAQLQQEQTDFALEQIEQNKEWAEQDYLKEQKGAYADYQKQSNTYGANAEAMASRGLTGTGYAESSDVAMYTAYQNRVATARESFNRTTVEFSNQMKDAILQNKSDLAKIAFETLQKKLELTLQGFQYKNTLLQQQLQTKQQTEDRYYTRWQNVLQQINTENSLEEQKRQFNEQMALQREELNFQKSQASRSSSGGGGGSYSGGGSSGGESGSISNSNTLTTAFYSGTYNKDALTNGKPDKSKTFSNGYQPNNVNGKKLTAVKTKDGKTKTIPVKSKTLQGTSVTTKQTVWKDTSGKKWVWDGYNNKYVPYK
jgi:hypothetical protein